jgi:hypothetical protein
MWWGCAGHEWQLWDCVSLHLLGVWVEGSRVRGLAGTCIILDISLPCPALLALPALP